MTYQPIEDSVINKKMVSSSDTNQSISEKPSIIVRRDSNNLNVSKNFIPSNIPQAQPLNSNHKDSIYSEVFRPEANFLLLNKTFRTKDYFLKPIFNHTDSTKLNTIKLQTELIIKPRYSSDNKDYIEFYNNTFLSIILFCVALLSWLRYAFNKYLNQFLQSIINSQELSKLYRDRNVLLYRVYTFLNIIFIITGGLFIDQILLYKQVNIPYFPNHLILFVGPILILLLYFYKYITSKISGFIFFQQAIYDEYKHNSFVFFKIIGMVLIPIITIVAFSNEIYQNIFINIGIFFVLMLYVIMFYKSLKIFIQKDILLFYWILYLCIVEILPLAIFYKLITTEL